jgi:hypothetical protein
MALIASHACLWLVKEKEMTIKQQGGIFGRNPTFNDVNATDITTTNLDAADIDVTNIDTGTLHVAKNIELTPASSTFGTAPAITHYTNGYVYITGGSGGLILRDDGGSVGIQIQNDDYIKFETGNPATEAARFNSSGNLAFPSGQGIDFSATSDGSGTTTSELFDDYEEGTWTGTLIGVTTAGASPTATGNYTKVGNRVHVGIDFSAVDTTGATGNIRVTGLPFTSTSASIGTCYNSRGPASTTIANMPTANTFINQINYAGSSQNWATSGTTYAGYVVTYKA